MTLSLTIRRPWILKAGRRAIWINFMKEWLPERKKQQHHHHHHHHNNNNKTVAIVEAEAEAEVEVEVAATVATVVAAVVAAEVQALPITDVIEVHLEIDTRKIKVEIDTEVPPENAAEVPLEIVIEVLLEIVIEARLENAIYPEIIIARIVQVLLLMSDDIAHLHLHHLHFQFLFIRHHPLVLIQTQNIWV
jgi:hypothetical protein